MKQEIEVLINISRYYGQQKKYVIAGGGNTSYKNEKYLWIKASGINLGNIDERGFCQLNRHKLNDISNQQFSEGIINQEEQVKNAIFNARINPVSDLRPSVETLLHNLFSYSFVVHTHMTLVNGLMCSKQAKEKTLEIFGESALFVPYSSPGFTFFKFISNEFSDYIEKFGRDPQIVLIQNLQ